MREYGTGLVRTRPEAGNLTDDVVRNAERHPVRVAFSSGLAENGREVTCADFLAEVRAVGRGLMASGVEAGDRVGLWSRPRYEWTLLDYAIWSVGAVTVPLYESSSGDTVEWTLRDAEARWLVVETTEQGGLLGAAARPESVLATWVLDDGVVEELGRAGSSVTDEDWSERRTGVTPDSLATIIYTSGTTGRPKGCMLTHGHFMVAINSASADLSAVFDADGATTVLFLPLAHVFSRVAQVGAVRRRVRLAYAPDLTRLPPRLREVQPTFLLGVPRAFERLFNLMSQQAAADGRAARFERAVVTAIAWSRTLEGRGPGPALRARHRFFDRTVYRRLRADLGGRCRYAVSGGASLGEPLLHFFRGIGLTVLEGYGLTETTAAVLVNRPEALKLGTAGRPMSGVRVRVSDDGELLVKAAQVFSGYWETGSGGPAPEDPVVDDEGWLHTGDLAEIDAEGFVRIVGRRQEVLVTTGGKTIVPEVLESRIRTHRLVEHCVIVGDGRPYAAALVTLDREATRQWAETRGLATADWAVLAGDADLRREIGTVVDEANRSVSHAESVRRFAILAEEWTERDGLLTPSLKVRRAVVLRACAPEIDRLFRT